MGGLDPVLLAQLGAELAKLRQTRRLGEADADSLTRLLALLQRVMSAGLGLDASSETSFLPSRPPPALANALEAASVVLQVMAADALPRTQLTEEPLEAAVALLRELLQGIYSAAAASADRYADADEVLAPAGKASRGRARSQKQKQYEKGGWLEGRLAHLLDLLREVVLRQALQETLLLELLSAALPAVLLQEGLPRALQLCALELVRAVYAQQPSLRGHILEELCVSLARLPVSRCGYPLPDEARQVQLVSALLLQLVQCSVAEPTEAALETALGAAHTFLAGLLRRCGSGRGGSGGGGAGGGAGSGEGGPRQLLEVLVQDLLLLLHLPEWPAAESVLRLLVAQLYRLLYSGQSGDEPSAGKGQAQLRGVALDLLGQIGAQLRREALQEERDRPASPSAAPPAPPAPPTDMDAAEDDSCICQQGYQGRFMVQSSSPSCPFLASRRVASDLGQLDCDDCHRWFHGSCVDVDPNDPPAIWYCDLCQLRRQKEAEQEKQTEERRLAEEAKARQKLPTENENKKKQKSGTKRKKVHTWVPLVTFSLHHHRPLTLRTDGRGAGRGRRGG